MHSSRSTPSAPQKPVGAFAEMLANLALASQASGVAGGAFDSELTGLYRWFTSAVVDKLAGSGQTSALAPDELFWTYTALERGLGVLNRRDAEKLDLALVGVRDLIKSWDRTRTA